MSFKEYKFYRDLNEVILALESGEVVLESDTLKEAALDTVMAWPGQATGALARAGKAIAGRAGDAAISGIGSGVIAGAKRGLRVAAGLGDDPRPMIADAAGLLAKAFKAAGKGKDTELQKAIEKVLTPTRKLAGPNSFSGGVAGSPGVR